MFGLGQPIDVANGHHALRQFGANLCAFMNLLGVPLTLISEAVFARCLSAQKEERVNAAMARRCLTV